MGCWDQYRQVIMSWVLFGRDERTWRGLLCIWGTAVQPSRGLFRAVSFTFVALENNTDLLMVQPLIYII